MTNMKRIITHNGPFHTDDVMAVAVLQLLLEKKRETYEVIRTRDEKIWPTGEYVVDVGGGYDAEAKRYDHHQKGGAGARENGVPYSSIGLVWKHHGMELVSSERVWGKIDEKLIQPLDKQDNGIPSYQPTEKGEHPYIIDRIVEAFYPTWSESATFDERFQELVVFFKQTLAYEIRGVEARYSSEEVIKKIYAESPDKRYIVLDKYYPSKHLIDEWPEPIYTVYPSFDGAQWMLSALRKEKDSFGSRKPLPASWAGLRDTELAKVTGVADAQFCHNALFIAAAKSKEGAIAMAKLALES